MADTAVVTPGGIGSRPSSKGRPSTADRLTPMPDYLSPISRSDAKKWQKLHEDHMMSKLLKKREEKKKLNQLTKQEVWKVAKKVPMEMLAKDWMQQIDATVETRAYLVDRILPTLLLGVEKLLQEVTRKGITESNAADPIFNPVNFLAQYLMRNNPRFSNFSEASPYVRGLREVGEELRKQLYDIEDNRLVRIKVEARRRREERELAEHMRLMEKQRREDALKKQFLEWDVGNFLDQRVELALIQNTLISFQELAELFPPELKKVAKLAQPLEPTDDTGRTMGQREFVAYVTQFIEDMPSEVFDQFHMHLSRCALAYRAQHEREERRIVLQQLFISCDHTGVGLIDRHRILNLFEMFWDKARDYIKSTLRNPRRWPVVDVTETSSYDDFDDEETSSEEETADITEISKDGTKTVPGEVKSEENLDDEEEAELAALTDGEVALPPSGGERPIPPQTTQSKVSFAEGTTFEKDRSQLQSRGSRSQSQASAFDENTLNLSQFVHLCETFLGDEPSMDAFNQLVNFIHDGYMETEDERMNRLMKARHEAQAQKRKALLNALFDMWDNDGSGALDLEEVIHVMANYKDGVEKDAVTKAKKEKSTDCDSA